MGKTRPAREFSGGKSWPAPWVFSEYLSGLKYPIGKRLFIRQWTVVDDKGGNLGGNIERRKYKRYLYEAIISHDILSQEAAPSGKIGNFSNTGLYFESVQQFYTGEEIFVEIIDHPQSSHDGLELLFDVEIVWRKDLSDSNFKKGYGAKFKTPVESIEKTIGEHMVRKSSPRSHPKPKIKQQIDARAYPRKSYRNSLLFNYKNTICRGLVTDISRGGACFISGSRVSLDQKIRFVITVSRTGKNIKFIGWIVRLTTEGFAVSFERRSGTERRYDIDRRIGLDRRKYGKPV